MIMLPLGCFNHMLDKLAEVAFLICMTMELILCIQWTFWIVLWYLCLLNIYWSFVNSTQFNSSMSFQLKFLLIRESIMLSGPRHDMWTKLSKCLAAFWRKSSPVTKRFIITMTKIVLCRWVLFYSHTRFKHGEI